MRDGCGSFAAASSRQLVFAVHAVTTVTVIAEKGMDCSRMFIACFQAFRTGARVA
jgi:hypothetical protein